MRRHQSLWRNPKETWKAAGATETLANTPNTQFGEGIEAKRKKK